MLDAWAIIKLRQSRPEGGFGRWRLTPPGMGTPPAGVGGSFTPLRGYTSSAPCGGTFSCAHPQCVPQGHLLRGAHWGALKGKSNEDVFFDDISLVNGWYADLLCQHLDIPVAFRDTFW